MPQVIFLGAGASKPFGIPTMKEFVDKLENAKVREIYKISDKEFFLYRNIKTILHKYFKGQTDFEAIYTVIDGLSRSAPFIDRDNAIQLFYYYIHTFNKYNGLEFESELATYLHEYASISKSLRMKIERFVINECKVKIEKREDIERIYDGFFNCLNTVFGHRNFWIYTTNYDRSIEYYFRSCKGRRIETGFGYDSNLGKSILNTGHFYSPDCKLIKIHGSISFFKNKRSGFIEELMAEPTAQFVPEDYEGQIMWYPIREKNMYAYPYLDMFHALKNNLNETNNWIIVGHSFNDSIIRDIFVECSKPENKVLIILKDKQEAKEVISHKLHDLKGKLIPAEKKFGDKELIEEITANFE